MRLLFLTHRLPYAPNRGDRVRAHFLLKSLSQIADVDVISLVHDDEEAAQVGQLTSATSVRIARVHRGRALVKSALALPTTSPLTHTMLDSSELGAAITAAVRTKQPDVVLAYCSGMARCVFAPPLATIPYVLDMVDVDSAKWDLLARRTGPPLGWLYRREARILRRFEATAAHSAFASTVVTEAEAETLAGIAPRTRVEVIPNGVDVDALRPPTPPATTRSVVFCGVMNYAPNVEAARLLATEVWPHVRRRHPDATLTLVGSQPTRQVLALASVAMGIAVTGAVPDVRPFLWNAAVAAAPLITARGIQNKVLEAVAAGLPTVITPNLVASLPDSIAPACVAAEGAEGIGTAIAMLLDTTPEARRARALNADVSTLTWERQLQPFHGLVQQASRSRREQA